MPAYPEGVDQWRRAGQIGAEARDLGVRLAVPGALRREIADAIEARIRSRGAEPSFPANLSRNNEAAHYTPSPDDRELLRDGDVVKIDVGAQIEGAISDTAITVEVGGGHRFDRLIRASLEGLEAGIAQVRPGVSVDEIGRAVARSIHSFGFKPVENLTGHTIERYLLHAGTSVPNVGGLSDVHLSEGQVVAIEPFATNGAGAIENGEFGNIVRFRSDPGTRDAPVAKLYERFRTLPFTARWLDERERATLRTARKNLQVYPVFIEQGQGTVAQAEHTVLVVAGGAEVLTRTPPDP